jgi:hypothetical protein
LHIFDFSPSENLFNILIVVAFRFYENFGNFSKVGVFVLLRSYVFANFHVCEFLLNVEQLQDW